MKKTLFLKLALLGTASLTTMSCQTVDKFIQVPINLDYVFLNENHSENEEDFFPSNLTTDELIMMLDTDQDFVLYFYQPNCPFCSEKATPKIKKFLKDKNNPIKLYAYDASNIDFSSLYNHETYGPYFDVTPKIMFFKAGDLFMTLSDKRYNDYQSFSSAMTSYCKKTNIYTASMPESINNFLDNNSSYLIYLNGEVKQDDIYRKNPSFEFYSKNVYPIMKDASLKTLVINTYDLTNEYKKELFARFDFDSTIDTWALFKNDEQSFKYNYQDINQSVSFIEALNKVNN